MRSRDLVLALGLYAVLDVSAAALLRSSPVWGPEALERRYRIPSPVFHHDLSPNVDLMATWGGIRYPLKTNSLGFRDVAVRTIPLRSSAPRMLIIGDSFTEGLGVPFPQTYAGLLQHHLAACGVEVLNAAVMSYSPSIYYRKIAYLLETVGLEVDYVLVALDLSDIGDEANLYGLDTLGHVVDRPAEAGNQLRSLLKRHSLLFHVLDLIRDGVRGRTADPTRFVDWTADSAQFEAYGARGLALAAARMDDLLELLRRRGVGLALVVYPYPAEVVSGHGRRHQDFWREWSARQGVPYFDLFPAFRASPTPAEAARVNFLPHDVHWSARGHALVEESLLRGGLLDTMSRRLRGRPIDERQCR